MFIYYTKKGKLKAKRKGLIPIKDLISTEKFPSIKWSNGNKEWIINYNYNTSFWFYSKAETALVKLVFK